VKKENLVKTSIYNLFQNFTFTEILKNGRGSLNFGKNYYEVLCNLFDESTDDGDTSKAILYFISRTDEKNLKKEFNDKKPVECIVSIDNYDEILQNTSTNNRAILLSNIDQKINAWVAKFNGIVKKYEKDEFFILFENKDFQNILQNKFEILDEIRNIDQGNKIPATLSIGAGYDGSIAKNDRYARSAIDMALGRGGDQAVTKDERNFAFFGAKSREIEKRTKVKVRVFTYALREMIDGAEKIIIMGHKNPDPDSLGAAVGVFRIAKNLGKDAYILSEKMNSNSQKILKETEKIPEYAGKIIDADDALEILNDATLLIVVDTNRISLVQSENILNAAKQVVLIDHHRKSEDFIETSVLNYHEPFASSTSEIVTEILQYISERKILKVEEAEMLLAGIVVDTKNFTFKTGVRTFEAAAYLKNIGADPARVKRIMQSDSELFFKKSEIISSVKTLRDGVLVACGSFDSDLAQVLAAQVADNLLEIEDAKASFVLVKSGKTVIVSGRSFGEINVQLVLEKLGGGGHMTVAGAQVNSKSLDEVLEDLKAALDEVLNG
jgi:c-di-AMP phosphodiesterase-like protein